MPELQHSSESRVDITLRLWIYSGSRMSEAALFLLSLHVEMISKQQN